MQLVYLMFMLNGKNLGAAEVEVSSRLHQQCLSTSSHKVTISPPRFHESTIETSSCMFILLCNKNKTHLKTHISTTSIENPSNKLKTHSEMNKHKHVLEVFSQLVVGFEDGWPKDIRSQYLIKIH